MTERIGPYELRRELGRGGLGVVYQARDPALERDVAVKVLLLPSDQGRFEREAQAVARLRHPNVVTVHGIGLHQRHPYLVMELLEGVSLARQLEGGPLEPRQAASLVRALADAVHAAHQEHVLHRDLRPGNVLLETDSNPVLIDFGLARRAGLGEKVQGEVRGSPHYLAPEQARGEAQAIGVATDVHGLGGILYATLTGRPPFEGEALGDVLLAVAEEPPRPPGELRVGIDAELEAICLRCLEKDPARRFLSAEALRDALDGWLAPKPPADRSRSPLAVLAVVVGAAVGVGLGWAMTSAPPAPVPPPAPAPKVVPPAPAPTTQERVEELMASVRAAGLLQRPEDILKLTGQVLALDSAVAEAYFSRASVLFLQGDLEEALADMERGLAHDPDSILGQLNRARLRFSLRDYEGGEADLKRYFELGGDRVEGLILRSSLARIQGRREDALRDLDEALALQPNNGMVLGARGEALVEAGRAAEAAECLERAVMFPDVASIPEMWIALGKANQMLRRFPESLEAYGHAAELGSQQVEARLGQAIALYEMQELGEALAMVEEVLVREPDLVWGRALRGVVLFETGRRADARKDLELAGRYSQRLPGFVAEKIRRYLARLGPTPPAPPSDR